MAVLDNPKQERFARLLAEDIDPPTAYQRAGYTPSKGAAIILSRRPNIVNRVDELRELAQSNLRIGSDPDDATLDDEETPENIEVTRVWLLQQLTDNVVKSKRAGQFSASNKAIELLGQYLGDMFGKNNKGPVDTAAAAAALNKPREAAGALLALADIMDRQAAEEAEAVEITPEKEEKEDVSGPRRTRKNQKDDREA